MLEMLGRLRTLHGDWFWSAFHRLSDVATHLYELDINSTLSLLALLTPLTIAQPSKIEGSQSRNLSLLVIIETTRIQPHGHPRTSVFAFSGQRLFPMIFHA